MSGYPYVWRWKQWPRSSWDSPGNERYGEPCRVVCRGPGRGPRNILVEFQDGREIVAPRFAVIAAEKATVRQRIRFAMARTSRAHAHTALVQWSALHGLPLEDEVEELA